MRKIIHRRGRQVWAYIILFILIFSVSMPSYGAEQETLSGKNEMQEAEQLPESMSLFSDELTLTISEDIGMIKPVFSPEGTEAEVSFQSEDEKIAQVLDDGTVIPVSLGDTYVCVSTPEGLNAYCYINIIQNENTSKKEKSQKANANINVDEKTESDNYLSEENTDTEEQLESTIDVGDGEKADTLIEENTANGENAKDKREPEQNLISEKEQNQVREYLQLSRKYGIGSVTESSTTSLSDQVTVSSKKGVEDKTKENTSGNTPENTKENVPSADTLNPDVNTVVSAVRSYMLKNDTNPDYSSIWNVIGMTRSGLEVPDTYINTFYRNVYTYLEERNWDITKTKYSDYSKLIIGLTAIGIDAQNVDGHNLLANLSDFTKVSLQGFNGPIWALIALKSSPSYEIPTDSSAKEQTTEEGLIEYLLGRETPSGGWSLMGTTPDVDITGMTIQALSSYYGVRDDVTQAIDRALSWLSSVQLSSGGYGTMGAETSESVAQVIVALSSLPLDCAKDARFIKNGKWPMTGLFQYYMPEGGFMHVAEGAANNGGGEAGKLNGMATEQGMYATVAYKRMLEGKTALYDMSDITLKKGEKPATSQPEQNSGDNTTASTKKTETTTASKKVNVIKVALNYSQITVAKGKSKTLKATVTPSNATNKTLKWTTSNKKVATVTSKGKVTGKKAGSATITVTAKDGSKKKAVCTVKVTAPATTAKPKTTVPTTRSQTKTVTTAAMRPTGTTVSGSTSNPTGKSTVPTTGTGANGTTVTSQTSEETATEEAGWSFDGEDYIPESQGNTEEQAEDVSSNSSYEQNPGPIPYVLMGGGGCGTIWAIWWLLRRKKIEKAEQEILQKAKKLQENGPEDRGRNE